MSFNNTKTSTQSGRGFTIVELLIVIVVIGILAAITLVTYNGVTQRAYTTSAQSAATTVLKKAEAYNADTSSYPVDPADLTTGASGKSYEVTGITFTTSVENTPGTVPTGDTSSVNFYTCDGALGVKVTYYNFSTGVWVDKTTGVCGGTDPYVAA
jgi:prepilin-type N-terminal cleavage/methylation domain-containing protein